MNRKFAKITVIVNVETDFGIVVRFVVDHRMCVFTVRELKLN